MDHQWVKNKNRASIEYVEGLKEFLNVAQQTLNSNGLTLCPCVNCLNSRLHNISVIRAHLIKVGIDKSYTHWVYHGEDNVEEEGPGLDNIVDDELAGLSEGLGDAIGHQFFNIGSTNDLTGNQQPSIENARYEKLYEALNDPLYKGCTKSSTLTFVVKLMKLKVMNKWTDSSFEMLLKLLQEVLPEGNNCPESYYGVRMLLCEVGLGYELIDVCQYDCAIFYGENKDAIVCPVCQSGRYVRNKIAYKKLRYFPLTPRLKRLYASRHTTKDMRWHKEVRKDEDGVLRHPADGKAWKHFDELYPSFANDPRSVRMGLASDGFNPFSNMTTKYSMWPVILMPYNMPPWCTLHKSNYLLTLLIPGPKSPGKDFDVFLRPLVDELKVLWCDGVEAYDEYAKSHFTLCDLWSTPKYLEIAKKKVEARRKRKWESRNGSKSIARYNKELGLDLNSSCGHIETWRSTHRNEEKGWTSLEASTKYEEMKKLRNENPVETMPDKYILEKVLGQSSNRLFGWGRSPVVSNSTNSNGSSNRPTYNQLIDRIQELEGNQETMKQLLIEKNIMPPTSGTPSEHDSGRSPHGNTCFGQSNDDFSENNDGYDNNIE